MGEVYGRIGASQVSRSRRVDTIHTKRRANIVRLGPIRDGTAIPDTWFGPFARERDRHGFHELSRMIGDGGLAPPADLAWGGWVSEFQPALRHSG